MPFIKFTRCSVVGESEGPAEPEDMPLPSQKDIQDRILPLMDRPDCFILSFTHLNTLFVEGHNKVGLVAYSLAGHERKYMTISCAKAVFIFNLNCFMISLPKDLGPRSLVKPSMLRILFSDTLACVDLEFAQRLMRDIKPQGAMLLSEMFKFDTDSCMLLADDTMSTDDHIGFTTCSMTCPA